MKINDLIKTDKDKQALRIQAISKSERYVVATKKAFGNTIYTIYDLKEKCRGLEGRVFQINDYSIKKGCEDCVNELEKNEIQISYKHRYNYNIIFINGKLYENGS
jgi:hypothetical protein